MYKDYKEQIFLLSDEQAGKLLKAIYNYVDGRNESDLDGMTTMCFSFIKNNLERDLLKYKDKVKTAIENGKKGGRPPKKVEKPKKPSGLNDNQQKPTTKQTKAKKGVIVIDNVIVTVIDNDIDIEIVKEYTKELELTKSICDFINMRKKIKKPISNDGLKKMLNKLNGMATQNEHKCKILDESVMNSWQGIFELKNIKKDLRSYNGNDNKEHHKKLDELHNKDMENKTKNLSLDDVSNMFKNVGG